MVNARRASYSSFLFEIIINIVLYLDIVFFLGKIKRCNICKQYKICNSIPLFVFVCALRDIYAVLPDVLYIA